MLNKEEPVAMETDATDAQSCFILFRKFMKEVSSNTSSVQLYDLMMCTLTCNRCW